MITLAPLALRHAVGTITATLLLLGCTASDGPAWTYAPLGPTPAASASPTAGPTGSPGESPTGSPGETPAGNLIEVELTGDLRILRDGQSLTMLHVTVGEEYTFRVTNSAGFVHNLYLGPAERLEINDVEGLPGVPDFTEGTEEFTWTASQEASGWQFACTVLGHYGPMHGDLVLEGN